MIDTELIEPALWTFLNAHDWACADLGRHIRGQGSRATVSASFTEFARTAAHLADAITAGPSHPVLEAMASAADLYQDAANGNALLEDLADDEPKAEFDGERIILPNATGGAAQRMVIMRLTCAARERWNEWAPAFFELVGLPYVSAPALYPTHHQSETVSS